jgi:hypothetical protein
MHGHDIGSDHLLRPEHVLHAERLLSLLLHQLGRSHVADDQRDVEILDHGVRPVVPVLDGRSLAAHAQSHARFSARFRQVLVDPLGQGKPARYSCNDQGHLQPLPEQGHRGIYVVHVHLG